MTMRTCSSNAMSGNGGIGAPLARASRKVLAYASANGGRPEMKMRPPYRTHRLNGPPVSGTSDLMTCLFMFTPFTEGFTRASDHGRAAKSIRAAHPQFENCGSEIVKE